MLAARVMVFVSDHRVGTAHQLQGQAPGIAEHGEAVAVVGGGGRVDDGRAGRGKSLTIGIDIVGDEGQVQRLRRDAGIIGNRGLVVAVYFEHHRALVVREKADDGGGIGRSHDPQTQVSHVPVCHGSGVSDIESGVFDFHWQLPQTQ